MFDLCTFHRGSGSLSCNGRGVLRVVRGKISDQGVSLTKELKSRIKTDENLKRIYLCDTHNVSPTEERDTARTV